MICYVLQMVLQESLSSQVLLQQKRFYLLIQIKTSLQKFYSSSSLSHES